MNNTATDYILIADSGSTKTHWIAATKDGIINEFTTSGLNPVTMDSNRISERILTEVVPKMTFQKPKAIRFYGAGCTSELCPTMEAIISNATECRDVKVASDMTGAAIALFDDTPGIACILGTGSNCCLFDGQIIIDNVSPLGYILGDEGSGAVIGRKLLGDILKHQTSEYLRNAFFSEYPIDRSEILRRVYREPEANRYLASFIPFVARHIHLDEVKTLIKTSFTEFFRRNILHFDTHSLPLGFVGSIATIFSDQLREVAAEHDCRIGRILQSPTENIAIYHTNIFF